MKKLNKKENTRKKRIRYNPQTIEAKGSKSKFNSFLGYLSMEDFKQKINK